APGLGILVLDCYAGRPADVAVLVLEVGPGGVDGLWVRVAVEGFELAAQLALLGAAGVGLGRGGRFLTGVGHAVEARLGVAAADGEVQRAVLRVDDDVGEG